MNRPSGRQHPCGENVHVVARADAAHGGPERLCKHLPNGTTIDVRADTQGESPAVLAVVLEIDPHAEEGVAAVPVGGRAVVPIRVAVVLMPPATGSTDVHGAVAVVNRPVTNELPTDL